MVEFAINPKKTAVISIDLQNCFVEGSPIGIQNGPRVVEGLNKIVSAFREAGATIIWTRHIVRPDHSNMGVLGETVPVVKHGLIDDGTVSADLHQKVDRQAGDIVLSKPHFGAFQSTDLETILRSRCIDTVVIGGIATNFCCETTAREAHGREFKVLFLSDGTSTFDLPDGSGGIIPFDQVQRQTLATLAFGFAEVLSIEKACFKLTDGSRASALRPRPQCLGQ